MEGTEIWSLADDTESQQSLEISTTFGEEEGGQRSPSRESRSSRSSGDSVIRSPLKSTRSSYQDLGATQTTLNSTDYDAQSERSISPGHFTSRSEEFQRSLQDSSISLQEEEEETGSEEDEDVLQPGVGACCSHNVLDIVNLKSEIFCMAPYHELEGRGAYSVTHVRLSHLVVIAVVK